MELLRCDLGRVYRKYLLTAMGSTIVSSIYSSVDMVAVGHACGPNGTAAVSCINPLWALMFSLAFLFGIGGAVHMSKLRGEGKKRESDAFFTLAMLLSIAVSLGLMLLYLFGRKKMLGFFGANEVLMPYAMDYSFYLALAVPAFIVGTVLSNFIRNDGAPGLCMLAIVSGGVLNIAGDYLLVFVLDMGMAGAGLATAVGQTCALVVLLSHFFHRKCTLRFVRCDRAAKKITQIFAAGFAPCIVDLSFGVTSILLNRQIMRYAGETELAVFGAVANIAILFQSLFYGVGQAIQPIISLNFGAGQMERVRETLARAVRTAALMSLGFFAVSEFFPEQMLRVYMRVNERVLQIGPNIFRAYAFSFLFMGLNVVSTYYFQSVLKNLRSTLVSLLRGFVLCALFAAVLPAAFGFSAIWWTMPLTEALTFVLVVFLLKSKNTREKDNNLLS